MKEVYKGVVGAELNRYYMDKPWSTKDLLLRDKREILVLHHRLNHFYLKSLIRLSKRYIIPSKVRKVIKIPPCVACMF